MKEDLLDRGFQSFAFDKNEQLRSVGVVQSLGPQTLYLETYLMKMRRIYYECTVNEVDWWPKGLYDTDQFGFQFGRIFGVAKSLLTTPIFLGKPDWINLEYDFYDIFNLKYVNHYIRILLLQQILPQSILLQADQPLQLMQELWLLVDHL